jgi:release factor glutamine methyltransferase
MKNSKLLFLDLINRIKIDESRDEIQRMAYIILESIFSISRTDVLSERIAKIGSQEEKRITEIIRRINTSEPIQYILEETFFYGRKFFVNPSVLIPRPETEELVRLILKHLQQSGDQYKRTILDIGTGSGCIPITLALECPTASVMATDVSEAALDVAGKNASNLRASVHFFRNDILHDTLPLSNLDVVVSNPPYIAWEEKEKMHANVVEFEPHLALFVPDNDPLHFYKAIAEKATLALRSGGLLVVEINERFGQEIAELFSSHGFTEVDVIRDLSQKERVVKGILP